MTDITIFDDRPLSSPQDTRTEFSGSGKDVRIGVEAEYQLTQASFTDAPMTIEQNERLGALLAQQGVELSQEATAQTVEIKTKAYRSYDLAGLEAELNTNFNTLARGAEALDLSLHDKAILDDAPFSTLLQHLNPRERAQIFFRHFLEHDRENVARYFSQVSGTQISLSYEDEAHGYALYKRVVLLAPILSALYQNLPAQVTNDLGEKEMVKGNLSLAFRLSAYGIDGAVPKSLWTASNAKDFFDKLNEELWQQELFCYYDEQGAFHGFDKKEDATRFADLPESLRIKANFQLLSSIQWHLASFSHLPANENGEQKRRIEVRYLDSLPPQKIVEAARFFSKLAFDQDFAARVDGFLEAIGFDVARPDAAKALWQSNIAEACGDHDLTRPRAGTVLLKQVVKRFKHEFL